MKTAMIFTDKMVLQRQKPIPVWGEAACGSVVSVALFEGEQCIASAEAVADAEGKWMVCLPAQEAAVDLCMVISSGEEKITLQQVCIGEVWIAGGQSNMEYLLGFEAEFDDVVQPNERNPLIRFFDYPEVAYEGALEDFDYKNEGFWRGCTAEDLAYFSAVGYYFSRVLQEDLQVPVGIVGCNWGGTPACAWMDPARLIGTEGEKWIKDYELFREKQQTAEFMEEFRKNPMNDRTHQYNDPFGVQVVKIGLSREQQESMMAMMAANMPQEITYQFERRPGGLYETMLKKIVPYGCRGVIWYQGETDGDANPDLYETCFSLMIENWRDLWQEELPFLFVQLAPFGKWLACDGITYHKIREQQQAVSEKLAKTWMASTSDCGMEWDIHPKRKRPVGERLALLARANVYGEDILCEAPKFTGASCGEDDTLVLTFAHAEGLHIEGDSIKELAVVRKDASGQECCEKIDAAVCGSTLVIENAADIMSVRFAKDPYYEVNLYNAAGVPALPFEWNR